MPPRRITFVADGLTLEGIFDLPERPAPVPGLVICHPHPLHGGDMDNNVVAALARAFAGSGYAVLRFNFRGVGRSTGSYAEGIGEREDARGALACISSQPGVDSEHLILAGYSFGARVTLAVAATDPRVSGMVAVAPPMFHQDRPSLETHHGPKLFVCGDADPYCPAEALTAWVDGLPEPKRLVVIPGTDHFFVGQERALGQHAVTLLREIA